MKAGPFEKIAGQLPCDPLNSASLRALITRIVLLGGISPSGNSKKGENFVPVDASTDFLYAITWRCEFGQSWLTKRFCAHLPGMF
jgi:hypothetical protein